MIRSFLRDDRGMELSEYAIAAALVTLVLIGSFTALGSNVSTVIGNLASKIK